jgi:hypothetical protein
MSSAWAAVKESPDVGIQLRVTNAKGAHGLIAQRGGKVSDLHTGDDGTVGFDVIDPDGNQLSVAEVPNE